MDQNSPEVGSPASGDLRTIEGSLKGLWERTRRAAELITELRGEKRVLQSRLEELERQVAMLQQELAKKEQLLRKVTAESGASAASRAALLAEGEREALAQRVKELLVKLAAYL